MGPNLNLEELQDEANLCQALLNSINEEGLSSKNDDRYRYTAQLAGLRAEIRRTEGTVSDNDSQASNIRKRIADDEIHPYQGELGNERKRSRSSLATGAKDTSRPSDIAYGIITPPPEPASSAYGGFESQRKAQAPTLSRSLYSVQRPPSKIQSTSNQQTNSLNEAGNNRPNSDSFRSSVSIDIDDATQVIESIELDDLIHDIESDEDFAPLQVRQTLRNKASVIPRILDPKQRALRYVAYNGLLLEPASVVELRNGDFMKIHTIYRNVAHEYLLIGQIYSRRNTIGTRMPRHRDSMLWDQNEETNKANTQYPLYYRGQEIHNEVIQKIAVHDGEHPGDLENETNCIIQGQINGSASIDDVLRKGVLTCRWKRIERYDGYGRLKEQSIERPSAEDLLDDWTSTSDQLQQGWRGHVEITAGDAKLTIADAFCGGGGVSEGAGQAGFAVVVSFDHKGKKIVTHQLNFPDCNSIRCSVNEFIERFKDRRLQVDVLHLSPPCQPYSAANTRPNQAKNDQNQAPLFACADVIRSLRPRIVTIEETPGILKRHPEWFNALVQQLSELGFSLRWATLRCADFGVPQKRERLIIIAAAPGEDLPSFPKPTHEVGTVTIQTVLDAVRVEPGLTHHDTRTHSRWARKEPYDARCLANTITCGGGGENYHPSGKRPFTIRELACLQTFPMTYRFPDFGLTELREQIGNAVPPLMMKAILETVKRSLVQSDEARVRRMRRHEVIDLTEMD